MKQKIIQILFSKKHIKRDLIVISIVFFVSVALVQASSLDSPGAPVATGYTLSDIYKRLTTNAVAVQGDHQFSPSANPASSFHTLKDIYDVIPTIDAGMIKLGTSYLGVSGTLLPAGGTADVGDVLEGKSFFGSNQNDWVLKTGTMVDRGNFNLTPGVSDQAVLAGYYSGGTLAGDSDLVSANIKSGITIFGVAGDSDVVDTSSGDAGVSDILAGKKAWVDGSEKTGTMVDRGNFNLTPGVSDQTVLAGYYSGGTLAGDSDLVANNIAADVDIFGVSGTLLKNLNNGSADSGDYPQNVGGVDDYDNNNSMPSDSYAGNWTTCDSSNNYCGTGDSTNADKKDDSTGLVWSKQVDGGDQTWFQANNCKYPNELSGDDGTCNTNGEVACKCVKLTDSKTGCEGLGDGNWRLPSQKELMQVYIDGSWGNLSSAGNGYWSATTRSNYTHYAWYTYLNNGSTGYYTKTNGRRVRCVR